jgi:hypothetical protein
MASLTQRFRSGWNAFLGRDPTKEREFTSGEVYGYTSRPDRVKFTLSNQRSVVASVYNRIAVDVSQIEMVHAKLDDQNHYKETIDSSLNDCLTIEANVDQTAKAFIQDIVESMFDEGVVAVVPTDTDDDPTTDSQKWDIFSMRTGRILEWYPLAVKVRVYNERMGIFQDLILPKDTVAIITNPFYATMNEPNSTLQRLIRTINKLDKLNEQNTTNKLNLIISLPYITKSEQRKKEAERRRSDLENQLENSPLGVAYADGTERITQLNRPLETGLWEQVRDLTTELFNKLGVTQAILDGTADEATTINYYNNTIVPICSAIADEFKRKFLSKTAITQGHTIFFYRDPFKLVPVSQLADIADKFRRNEIMTSNEMRAEIGMKPNDSEKADDISNPNLNKSNAEVEADGSGVEPKEDEGGMQDV